MGVIRSLQQSEADIYHIFVRGMGRQLLFEDDVDRGRFLAALERALEKNAVELYAWVLMGNHVHLLAHAPCKQISALMKSVEVSYARFFNQRHERVGSLFQGRFGSQAIHDEAQLLAAVRYIHANPCEAGIAQGYAYRWSSYGEYTSSESDVLRWRLCNTEFVLAMLHGRVGFDALHERDAEEGAFIDEDGPRGRTVPMPDSVALAVAEEELGAEWRTMLCELSREERNAQISQLREAGLSIRQIERLTGLGRGIISRACVRCARGFRSPGGAGQLSRT